MKFLLFLTLLPICILSVQPAEGSGDDGPIDKPGSPLTRVDTPVATTEVSQTTEVSVLTDMTTTETPDLGETPPAADSASTESASSNPEEPSTTTTPKVTETAATPTEAPAAAAAVTEEPVVATTTRIDATETVTVTVTVPTTTVPMPVHAEEPAASASVTEESAVATPTSATETPKVTESETTPSATEEPAASAAVTEKPVLTRLILTGAIAVVDGVTVRFRSSWKMDGGALRRLYSMNITNGSEKDVCGVTFTNNVKSTYGKHLSVNADGSLSTKNLRLAPGNTSIKSAYVTVARSRPTILSVTYC